MSSLVEVRGIVRREVLDRVVRRLEEAVPRITVTRIHAVGAGVHADPASISVEEGAYRDMAMVQCVCAEERSAMITELIVQAARTGRPGDGIVSVHPVRQVTKIRTGQSGLAALG